MNQVLETAYKDSKSHYHILDGLRGVAAVMVVLFHILEIFSNGDHSKQLINHGYLAVDFFFVLSGFVIAYAYDDRWSKMSLKEFAKRRLIRLHPMIIIGMIVGAATFYFQGGNLYPMIDDVPVVTMLLIMFIGFTLIPVPPSMDIRGWVEMHPLNGPAWSLFFEYIANICYALFLRKFSNTVLIVIAFIAGGLLIHMAVTHGDIIGGWSLYPEQLRIGFTRLAYPFIAGMLLSRLIKPANIRQAFLICSILLLVVFCIPWVGGHDAKWMNGLYDSLIVILVFPLIVYLGASGKVSGVSEKVCNFLGNISYPIYITHYPFIYIFMAWAQNGERTANEIMTNAAVTFVVCMVVAYLSYKLYDVPVRKWLSNKFMK